MTARAASLSSPRPHWLDDRRFWSVAAVTLGTVSLLKGMRMPGRWAATQALVDYDQGFVKRGLFGQTAGHWLHLERYGRFSLFSYAVLLVFVALLVTLTVRSGALERLGTGEPVLLFAASFATTWVAHLVGYMDVLLGTMTVALLLVRQPFARLLAAVPVTVLALLMHEMFLLAFLPVVLLSLAVDAVATGEAQRRRLVMGCAGLSVLALGMTCGLAFARPLSAGQVAAMETELAARANFPLRTDVFDVMMRGFFDNVAKIAHTVRTDPGWDITLLLCAVVFAPTLYLLVRGVRWASRAVADESPLGRRLPVLAVAAALSPLGMYAVAWDSGRWDALVCLDAFLVLLVLARALPGPMPRFSGRFRNATVLAVGLSIAAGEGLMDYRTVNTYPFVTDFFHAGAGLARHGWVAPADARPGLDQ